MGAKKQRNFNPLKPPGQYRGFLVVTMTITRNDKLDLFIAALMSVLAPLIIALFM